MILLDRKEGILGWRWFKVRCTLKVCLASFLKWLWSLRFELKDSHVIKSIRSLVYWSSVYGHVTAGDLPGKLPNVSGDIFQRSAGVIMQQMGWCREGEKRGAWDMSAKGWRQGGE